MRGFAFNRSSNSARFRVMSSSAAAESMPDRRSWGIAPAQLADFGSKPQDRGSRRRGSGRILTTNTTSCWMQIFRSINDVAAFGRMKPRTSDRAVVRPGRDVDQP